MTATFAARRRLTASLAARLTELRASALWSPAAWEARARRPPPDADHAGHIRAALDWLCRAQDAAGGAGISRGYGLTWDPTLRRAGWQPPDPEATACSIPTLFHAADRFDRAELVERALRAAHWRLDVRSRSGGLPRGGAAPPIAALDAGPAILGWLAAWDHAADVRSAEAALAAGRGLAAALARDAGAAGAGATPRAALAAWALAEAGVRLGEAEFRETARACLRSVAARQRENGWIPGCAPQGPEPPDLAALADAVRGLLEGGRVLAEPALLACAMRTARALAAAVRDDGRMPGRLDPAWRAAARWSCLPGQARIADAWLRLLELTGDASWIEPSGRVVRFLKATQHRASRDPGLRGGILGASPAGAGHAGYQVLAGATRSFVDTLIRHRDARLGATRPVPVLA
ncbi:MAG TPA: hypothetical protein VFQ38_22195 [Longimicrobiales bacterium]|nr:hypothetical protein [Longimicrobiales bacterium]